MKTSMVFPGSGVVEHIQNQSISSKHYSHKKRQTLAFVTDAQEKRCQSQGYEEFPSVVLSGNK